MQKIPLHTEIDSGSFLASIAKLKINELEEIIEEINAIISKKKSKDRKDQIAILLRQHNETVLDKEKQIQYLDLLSKLESESINEFERKILNELTIEEEDLRNKRIQILIKLSQLRDIPFTQQMKELGLNPPINA